jgi:methionyl-tRNA formyltransferase
MWLPSGREVTSSMPVAVLRRNTIRSPVGDQLGPVQPTEASTLAPGELRVEKAAVFVGTGTADVRLGEVRPAGKRPMPAADWARGARLQSGELLG